MTDHEKWVELFKFAKDNKLPRGEYCLWGRECREREANGTHEGRRVFYLNEDGFSVSYEDGGYDNGKQNFKVEIERSPYWRANFKEYDSDDMFVRYQFDLCPYFLTLSKDLGNTKDLAALFTERVENLDVDYFVNAMRGDFEYYLENSKQLEEEKRQRGIEKKKRELAALENA